MHPQPSTALPARPPGLPLAVGTITADEHAVAQLAEIAAARAALDRIAEHPRDHLDRAGADRPGRARWEHDGHRAHRTDPKAQPKVIDVEAWEEWAARRWPERTKAVPFVRVGDVTGFLTAVEAAEEAAAVGDLDGVTEALADLRGAVECGADVLFEERTFTDAAKRMRPVDVRDGGRTVVDGRAVDVDTGEVVPGVEYRRLSDPKVTFTPDPAAVAVRADEMLDQFAALGVYDRPPQPVAAGVP
jgi:hypothetical protein